MDIEQRIHDLQTNLDAVERFLALYDLYRYMTDDRPTVAEASTIDKLMQQAAETDRDLNVRAWARYFHERVWGERGLEDPKPHLPKIWQLLIVEEL